MRLVTKIYNSMVHNLKVKVLEQKEVIALDKFIKNFNLHLSKVPWKIRITIGNWN